MLKNKIVVKCPYCNTYWSGISVGEDIAVTNYGITYLDATVKCLTCGGDYIPSNTSYEMYDFVADNFMKVKGQ